MSDNSLTPADMATARSALLFVRRAIAARREPTAALDRALAGIDTALAASDNGSDSTPKSDNGFEDEWVSTTEAAKLLRTSERWAREIAHSIGGRKFGGRWFIPRCSLPEDETHDR